MNNSNTSLSRPSLTFSIHSTTCTTDTYQTTVCRRSCSQDPAYCLSGLNDTKPATTHQNARDLLTPTLSFLIV